MRADLCHLQRRRFSFTDRVFPGLGRFCRQVILGLALILTPPVVSAATTCSGQHNVHLTQPVDIDAALQAELARLPTLRVLSIDAPPLVHYDPDRKGYDGIAVDILCFIAAQLNIRFALVSDPSEATSEKLQQVQKGEADVFVPLSQNRHIEQQRRALQEANLKLEELTRTDTLTNLPNRRFFDAKLNEAYLQYLRGGAPL